MGDVTPVTIHSTHPASPLAMWRSIWEHRHLLGQITKRDIAMRYRGSALGLLWSFVTPLLMLGVYTFVFGVVFNARFGTSSGEDASTAAFALTLFCGLIIHGIVAECLTRSPTIILNHANYVKKVVFPLEILPVMLLGSAGFHFLTNLAVLLAGWWLAYGGLPLSAFLFPLTILPLVPLLLALNWILAALGVYLRDIHQLSGLLSMVLLFLSPIFYPASALPESFRALLYANPLTLIIESARATLTGAAPVNWLYLSLFFAVSLLAAIIGFWWFQKTRKGFADIL